MAKLGKQIRKGVGGVVRSSFVQSILRDLIKAAVIGAAAKLAESGPAQKAARKAKGAIGAEGKKGKKGKSAKQRKARAPR